MKWWRSGSNFLAYIADRLETLQEFLHIFWNISYKSLSRRSQTRWIWLFTQMNFKRRACLPSAHRDKSPTAVMNKLPKTDCGTKWMLNFATEQQQQPTCSPSSRAHNWEVREQLGLVRWRPHMLPSPLGTASLRRLHGTKYCLWVLPALSRIWEWARSALAVLSGTARAAASPPAARSLQGTGPGADSPDAPWRCGTTGRHPARTLWKRESQLSLRGGGEHVFAQQGITVYKNKALLKVKWVSSTRRAARPAEQRGHRSASLPRLSVLPER